MKKHFLPPLLVFLLLIFGLASCNSNVNSNANVSMTFPVTQLYNQISAREGTDSITLNLEVTLFVNGVKKETKSAVATSDLETQTFEFSSIPLNSTVYAEAWVKSITVVNGLSFTNIMLYGKTNDTVVASDAVELELELNWYEENGEKDKDEGTTPLVMQYWLKNGSTSTLYESTACKTNYTVDEIREMLREGEKIDYDSSFYRYYEWDYFFILVEGLYPDIDENTEAYEQDGTNTEAYEQDGTIYVQFHYIRTGEPEQYKEITGTANGQNYTLKLYAPQLYSICDSAGNPFVLGMWETSENGDSVCFTELMYKKNDKPLMTPFRYVDGKFSTDMNINLHPDIISWNSETSSFKLNYYYEGGSLPITFTLKENFDIGEFEINPDKDNKDDEGHGNTNTDPAIDLSNDNILIRFYTKDSTNPNEQYKLYSQTGGNADYTYDQVLDNAYLPFSDDSIYANSTWYEFKLIVNGYESPDERVGDTDPPVTVTQEDGKICVNYYLIKKAEPASKVTMKGTSGKDTYTLVLYDLGDYEILDSANKTFLFGIWGTGLDGQQNNIVSFSEFMYKKDGQVKFSPNFYVDGELVMNGDDPRYNQKPDCINWNSTDQTFSLTYYYDDKYYPITFEKPANFNIVEFDKHSNEGNSGSSGSESSIHSTIVIPGNPTFTISKTFSDDSIYLNDGLVSFNTIYTEEEFTWSVTLFDGGKEVPDSAYDFTSTNSECTIRPLSLPGAENEYATEKYFIAHVTAVSATRGTVATNFEVRVQNMNKAWLNLNDEDFLTKLITFFENANGPIQLKLSGTGFNPVYNPDANVYKMVSYTINQYAKHNVELDFSGVLTPNAYFVDFNDFSPVVKKITLPTSITAIKFNPNLTATIIAPDENYYTDKTWYSVKNLYTPVQEELEKIYEGYPCDLSKLTNNGATCTEVPLLATTQTSWETLVVWISNNYRDGFEVLEDRTIFVKGE